MYNWASMPISLTAGVGLTVNLPMAANLIMVRNPDTTNSIYISATANISSTIRDSVANVGNYGFLVRPMPLRTFYLLSVGDISGIEVFFLRVENPMDFLHLMAQPPTQLAAITSSALPSGASTEATQLLVKAAVDAASTEATQLLVKAAVDSIKAAVEGVLDVQLSGSNAEIESAQETETATTVETYSRSVGATEIEIYVEDGAIRVRTDGETCTSSTGEPLSEGYYGRWAVASVSVYYVQESIITVVSR